MGSFSNTKRYENTVTSLTDGLNDRLKNPYYAFTDKKPVIVEYYNQNIHKSTLDESTKLKEDLLGDKSPTKYNLIHNVSIFGNGIKLEQSLDIGQVGLESNSLELEFYILPDTFIPHAEDFLTIPHSGKTHLYKVTQVTPDTLENGANFYKINIKYWTKGIDIINNQVVEEYEMIVNYVGTQYKSVIKSSEYKFIERLDIILERLYDYYNTLFFKSKVQCHVCPIVYDEYFYDPYLYEFIIKNNVFNSSNKYIHMTQPIDLPAMFIMSYDKSFFRALEEKNIKYFKIHSSKAIKITQPFTLFSTRRESYYYINYNTHDAVFSESIQTIDPELISKIENNVLYDKESNKTLYNIIIKYFNDIKITTLDLDTMEDLNFLDSKYLYYTIPEVMYIIQHTINTILK